MVDTRSTALCLSEDDHGTTVTVVEGDELTLSLHENPASGYRWQLRLEDAARLRVLDESFAASSEAVGSGGRAVWRLRAEAVGVAHLHARCARLWQGAAANAEFELTVKISARSRFK